MSLYGMMRTGVSGMEAQSNRLGTVADNIANSGTTGYKRAYTEFSSLILPGEEGSYSSGAVKTTIRNAISSQGVLQFTSSTTDLAIDGTGFFVVQDQAGTPYLSRGGAFVPDGQGNLINAAGQYLLGYSYENGEPAPVTNGFNGLEIVSIADFEITAAASTQGSFAANLPAMAEVGDTEKTSFVLYDNLGREVLVDVVFTKTAEDAWRIDLTNQAGGDPSGSIDITFDPDNGNVNLPAEMTFDFPDPGDTFTFDFSGMTQLATAYTYSPPTIDGSSPSPIEEIRISDDGIVSALYKNGRTKDLYRIPLASVQSPDQLDVLPGNVYQQSSDSGDIRIGFANQGDLGSVVSGALEGSNVDIAEELTNMIQSQRNYTANSKVFQTGADLLDVLVNLKR